MAISRVGTDTGASVATNIAFNLAYPAGIASGDLILVAVMGLSVPTTPTGFTLIDTAAPTTGDLTLYARYADGTETGNLSIPAAGAHACATMGARRGSFTSATANLSALVKDVATSSSAAITSTALTSVPEHAAWLQAFGGANGSNASAQTCTVTGSNWTKRGDVGDGSGTHDGALSSADNTSDFGTANAVTFTWSASQGNRAVISFWIFETPNSLSPAPVGSVTGASAASGTSLTVAAPASLVKGNILLAVIGTVSTSSALVQPAGWVVLDTPAGAIASAYKIIDGTEGANFTWTWTGASVSVGLIIQIGGVGVVPIEESAAQANSSSANITAPTLTPRWNSCMLATFYLDIGLNTITEPFGQTFQGAQVGNSRSLLLAYETLYTNTATGTRVATATAAVNYGFSILIRGPQTNGIDIGKAWFGVDGPAAYRDSATQVTPTATALGIGVLNWSGRDPFTGFPGNNFNGYGGTASISGICKIDNQPFPGIWVYLSPMSSQGTVIAAQYTGDDGTFSFNGIAPGQYVIEGVDPTGNYNGQIYEEVTAY